MFVLERVPQVIHACVSMVGRSQQNTKTEPERTQQRHNKDTIEHPQPE